MAFEGGRDGFAEKALRPVLAWSQNPSGWRSHRRHLFGVLPLLRKPAADLKRHGRLPGHAKALALELACRYSGPNQRETGRHFGNLSSMAACTARWRFREDQAQENPALQKTLAKLERMIRSED